MLNGYGRWIDGMRVDLRGQTISDIERQAEKYGLRWFAVYRDGTPLGVERFMKLQGEWTVLA